MTSTRANPPTVTRIRPLHPRLSRQRNSDGHVPSARNRLRSTAMRSLTQKAGRNLTLSAAVMPSSSLDDVSMSKHKEETSAVLIAFYFNLGMYFLFMSNKFSKICLHI
jgi:hypothetical protein